MSTPEEAGVPQRRGADAQVDLARAGAAQQADDLLLRRPPHDAVVDHDDALAAQHLGQRVVLQARRLLAHRWSGWMKVRWM